MMHCQETDSIRSDNKNKCVAVGIELTGEYIVVRASAVHTSDTRGYPVLLTNFMTQTDLLYAVRCVCAIGRKPQ
jgi:hypothetical protein